MAEAFEKMLSGRRTAAVLLNADPPEHVRQRRVVNAAFRPARIRELEPKVLQRSDELIAIFADRGTVEFVSEYAVLLPMRIIADALGVGDDDLLMFKQWSELFFVCCFQCVIYLCYQVCIAIFLVLMCNMELSVP